MTQGSKGQRPRRGWGEGSVSFDERRGRWIGSIEVGRDAQGRRQRRRVIGRTKGETLRKLTKVREQAESGQVVSGANLTVGAFLQTWLATVIPGRVHSTNTIANYTWAVGHILPALGGIRLSALTPEDVDRLLADKAGMARNSVSRIRSVLADALRHAERRGMVGRNAATLAVMPASRPTIERRSLTPAESISLMHAAQGERLEALVACGLMLGLRPGELTGLRWADLDMETGTLAVSGSLKREKGSDGQVLYLGEVKRAKAGQRTIALPPSLVAHFRNHRRRQAAERLVAGNAWRDNGLVFSTEVGTFLDPSNVRRTFSRIAKRAGLDGGFPYELRHTAASLLIDAGKHRRGGRPLGRRPPDSLPPLPPSGPCSR